MVNDPSDAAKQKRAYRGVGDVTDWFEGMQDLLTDDPSRTRTPREQTRRLTVLALRAAQALGTSDLVELREMIKDAAAKEHLPYNGQLIDSALRRAIGIRGQAL